MERNETSRTARLIAETERLQGRFMEGKLDRRQMLQGLFALGLSSTAVSMVMGDRALAQTGTGTGEQIWDGKPFDAGGETVTVAH